MPKALATESNRSSNSQRQPKFDNDFDPAIDFVKTVRQRFVHEPAVFNNFLDVMTTFYRENYVKDYKPVNREPVSTLQVRDVIARLLRNHEDLVREFNKFLLGAALGAPSTIDQAKGLSLHALLLVIIHRLGF